MWIMSHYSHRGGNFISSSRRMCTDPQRTHPNRRYCVWINKRESEKMAERSGKKKKRKASGAERSRTQSPKHK